MVVSEPYACQLQDLQQPGSGKHCIQSDAADVSVQDLATSGWHAPSHKSLLEMLDIRRADLGSFADTIYKRVTRLVRACYICVIAMPGPQTMLQNVVSMRMQSFRVPSMQPS